MLHVLWRAATTRFIAAGLAVTALHLAVFQTVLPWSVPEVANVVAFLVATQVNFFLSYYWTWSDRRPVGRQTVGSLARRAALFNGSAAFGFGVNAAGFSTALRVVGLPPLHSAVAATVASAAATFVLSSRLVFARRPTVPTAVDVLDPVPDLAGPIPTPLADRG
ncbi:GtrA family protein [Geodermatophilus sp. DSM 44513]|uniref:GtrA family protein n=1 Tax=Geodermatophilus sp. DSM 44513 TaxID=1528104 RepID=UPI0012801D5D|nr:GtrA family protein [Geodermatophilus sp. DSM 44513]WNV75875.1 GtrA family protein [Geodermatophilus sp. DSM 44513]